MTSHQEIINIYNSVFEAEAAKEILHACGIAAYVAKDDCGGMRPELQFSQGVKLLVPAEYSEKAKELLNAEPISIENDELTDFMTEAEEQEFEELKKEYAEKKSNGMTKGRTFFLFLTISFFCFSLLPFEESEIFICYGLRISSLVFLALYIWVLRSRKKSP